MTSDPVGAEHGGALSRMLADHAARRPSAAAVETAGRTWSYAELDRAATRAAHALAADGLAPGDRVAVISRNTAELVALHFAAARARVILVVVNWRQSPAEAAAILADAEPSVVIAQREWAPLLADADPELPTVWFDGPPAGSGARGPARSYAEWLEAGAGAPHRPVAAAGQDVVLMLYTTGTTGRPKGVMLTEAGIMAALAAMNRSNGMGPESRMLAMFPMFHVGGMAAFLAPLMLGGTVVTLDDTSQVARTIAETRASHTGLVPTLLNQMVHDPLTPSLDFSNLRVLGYGAAPASDTVVAQAMALLPRCAFTEGYGMTETAGMISLTSFRRHGDPDDRPGSVGQPVPGLELRIVDPQTLRDCPVGTAGEIWVRSPHNALGYWRRPEETARSFLPDGWLRTGDVGAVDADGYIYIKDRIKDMIISGGENVYSVEVENTLMAHPEVREVAVYGVPHQHWGETVKAVVALAPGSRLSEAELIRHTRDRLAHYKCPTIVEFMDELPKSGNSKIVKHELRARDHAAALAS